MTVILDMSVGLDGSISGADGGDAGLHDWYFDPDPASLQVRDDLVARSGALVIGRGIYGTAPDAQGWEDSPYLVPHFVVTHEPPSPLPTGDVEFRFVSGVEEAIAQARAAAGDGLVVLGGGADVARQCLDAGLVDELHLHVASVVPGGPRLLDGLARPLRLDRLAVVEGVGVTHLHYRVERD
jgi:dihydrofolate reductase